MKAWEHFVQAQEGDLGVATVQKWLKSLKVLRFDACNLYLEAKDSFQALWFEEHMRSRVQAQLFNNNQKRIKVHLSIANVPSVKSKKTADKRKGRATVDRPSFSLEFDELDPQCVFDQFIVSPENVFTYKLFAEIAGIQSGEHTTPLAAINPIYLHGAAGSGKTHLLIATAAALRARGLNVIYARAQTFTDHVVAAIRAGEMSLFRQMYRSGDVLIIDDVHVFSRKGATQEEFFHTFNTLHMVGKQIILSANCAPGELSFIEPRLVSRFEWGVVLSLESMGKKDAAQMLQAKAAAMEITLHPKVEEFLLDSFSSVKSLTRALKALVLRFHLYQTNEKAPLKQITITWAQQVLADLLQEEKKAAVTSDFIFQGVAEYFGIRVEDILGTARTRDCVLPRQLAMFLCRQLLKLPYLSIGELFGKDHSTVMSSVKMIQKKVDADNPEVASAYRAVLKKVDRMVEEV